MSELISVIVPVYNAESYLHLCIDSVLKQSYQNIELVLIDDESTDNSASICKEYVEKDTRVKYIHVPNGGVSYARNIGIEHATGVYISFLDCDDWLVDGALEYLYQKAVEHDADISMGNYLQYIEETQEWMVHVYQQPYYEKCWTNRELLEELPFLETIDFSYTHPWGRIYKKELFETIRFPNNRVCEDLAVNYRLYGKAKKIVYGHKEIVVWRKRSTSQSAQFSKKYILNCLQVLDERMTYMMFKDIPLEKYKLHYLQELHHLKEVCNSNEELKASTVELLVEERLKNYS